MKAGDKINYLTFLNRTSGRKGLFRCDCGVEKEIRISAVKDGGTKSCGCHRKKVSAENGKGATTHGMTNHPIYRIWIDMKSRHNVCNDWVDFVNFRDWIMPLWKPGLVPGRIDYEKDFNPSNCILKTSKEAKLGEARHTNLKKYGCSTPLKNKKVQEKIQNTFIDKYGYKRASQSEIVKDNTIKNNREKYGVDFPQQLPRYKELFRKKTIDNGQANYYNDKTGAQWAQELGLSAARFNKLVELHGFESAINHVPKQSFIEKIISDFLSENNIDFSCKLKLGEFFPDFVIDSHKLIIEADGLYWHSDAINPKTTYHKNKKEEYLKLGYRPLFFREDEIHNKNTIVFSIIKNALNMSNKIGARKCDFKLINDTKTRKEFCQENHLMGAGQGLGYGLFINDELVTLMQIIDKRTHYEISRFCNKVGLSVIGGFSKLLDKIPKDKPIITFIDERYGDGSYLNNFGFDKQDTRLSFKWVKNGKSEHRMKFKKNTGYDFGYYKLWDCGQTKWIKKPRL